MTVLEEGLLVGVSVDLSHTISVCLFVRFCLKNRWQTKIRN